MIDQLYSDYSNMSCAHIGADSKWFLLGNEGSDLPQQICESSEIKVKI